MPGARIDDPGRRSSVGTVVLRSLRLRLLSPVRFPLTAGPFVEFSDHVGERVSDGAAIVLQDRSLCEAPSGLNEQATAEDAGADVAWVSQRGFNSPKPRSAYSMHQRKALAGPR